MIVKVIFTWRNDLLGRLARKFGMVWSHVGLLCGEDPKWIVFEASMTGIRVLNVDEFIPNWDEYKTLSLVDEIPLLSKAKIVSYAFGNVGKPYAFWMLPKLIWKYIKDKFAMRVMTHPSEVCSSFVDECFNFIGIDLVPGKDRFVLPDDIFLSRKLGPDTLE